MRQRARPVAVEHRHDVGPAAEGAEAHPARHVLAERRHVRRDAVVLLQTAGGVELAQGEDRAVRNTVEDRLANAEPALRLLFGGAQKAAAP